MSKLEIKVPGITTNEVGVGNLQLTSVLEVKGTIKTFSEVPRMNRGATIHEMFNSVLFKVADSFISKGRDKMQRFGIRVLAKESAISLPCSPTYERTPWK